MSLLLFDVDILVVVAAAADNNNAHLFIIYSPTFLLFSLCLSVFISLRFAFAFCFRVRVCHFVWSIIV